MAKPVQLLCCDSGATGTHPCWELPEIRIKGNILKQGINILDLLSSNNIMSSKSEARRAIKIKALKIDRK